MRDAGEQREIRLGDTERLVGAIGLAPGGDLLAAHANDAGNGAARMDGPARAIERRRIVVMNAPPRRLRCGIARPRDLVGLGEGDGVVEGVHAAESCRNACSKASAGWAPSIAYWPLSRTNGTPLTPRSSQ